METKIWEVIITRQLKIKRLPMNFEDYTDWCSDLIAGRINTKTWGNFIIDCVTKDPILTVDGEELEVLES